MIKGSLTIVFLLLISAATFAQPRISGEVIDVTDGRTMIVNSSAGKITVRLHAIDTPESTQPLYVITREHLARMVKGKRIDYELTRIEDGVSVSRVYVAGVDVSLQMIRDGAAWHLPVKLSGQSAAEAAEYAENQELARKETRGVWSQTGLKPAWEYRAEREESERKLEAIKRIGKPNYVAVSEFKTANSAQPYRGTGKNGTTRIELDTWVTVLSGAGKESVGLQTYMDPQGRFGAVYNSAAFVYLGEGEKRQKLETRAIYYTVSLPNGRREDLHVLGFQAFSQAYSFSIRKSSLTAIVDGTAISLGSPRGVRGETAFGMGEILFYRLSRANLKKIASGKNVVLKINGMSGELPEETKALFLQLVEST